MSCLKKQVDRSVVSLFAPNRTSLCLVHPTTFPIAFIFTSISKTGRNKITLAITMLVVTGCPRASYTFTTGAQTLKFGHLLFSIKNTVRLLLVNFGFYSSGFDLFCRRLCVG